MPSIVVLLLVLIAELLLRVYHRHTLRQRLPTELRAETRALTWDSVKDKYRIVCFGDSVTFGEGLPYEKTYPAVLAGLLQQKRTDVDAVVINSGMCGHTSVQGLARLERDVLWYKPHVVVMAFGLNDGRLGYWPLDPLRERAVCGDASLQGRLEPLLQHSHLWLTLRARTRRLLRRLGWHGPQVEIRKDSEPQPRVSPQGFQIAQARMAASIQHNGDTALFLLTTTPVTEAFMAGLSPVQRQRQLAIYEEYNHIISEAAATNGCYLVDVHTLFPNDASAELASLLAADGVHLTAPGERLLAEIVFQTLEESGLLVP